MLSKKYPSGQIQVPAFNYLIPLHDLHSVSEGPVHVPQISLHG